MLHSEPKKVGTSVQSYPCSGRGVPWVVVGRGVPGVGRLAMLPKSSFLLIEPEKKEEILYKEVYGRIEVG